MVEQSPVKFVRGMVVRDKAVDSRRDWCFEAAIRDGLAVQNEKD